MNNDIIDTTTTKTSKRSVSSATARFATVGMAGLLLLGGAAVGAPAMAAGAAPVGDASAAVAGSQHGKRQVSLKAPRSATTGTKVTLKGKVKKNRHHKTRVLIQKKHGKKWTKLDSTKTNKKGTFRTSDVLTGKKKVTLRAKAKGHGTSATQTVKLTKATNSNGTPAAPATPAQPAQPAAPQPQPQPAPVDPLPDSGHVVNVSNGQQLQDELAKAGGQTVTIKLNGPPFTANQAQDSFGDFASVFTVGGNSNVTLTGQGTLDANKKGNTVGVHSGSTLTIDGDITITNGAEKVGGGIYNEGTVNLKNGATVTGNTATDTAADHGGGGGIYNGYEDPAHPGTLTLEKGAAIHDNKAGFTGGGIENNIGTVNINGGSISSNHAAFGGGIDNNGGTVNLTGGTITGNFANDGGGIDNDGGTVNLTGGTITGNNAHAVGGGIYVHSGTLKVKGNKITAEVEAASIVYGNTAGAMHSDICFP